MRDLPVPAFPLAGLWPLSRPHTQASPHDPLQRRPGVARGDRMVDRTTATGRRDGLAIDSASGLEVIWARDAADILDAQRLRYRVFCEEMGARLCVPPGSPAVHDVDMFDAYCEHLLVRESGSGEERGRVLGTYRVLTPVAAAHIGGFYCDTEFDLTRLRLLRHRLAELGRSCVHDEHRNGGVILALWSALAGFMARNSLDIMIGCASVSVRDGGHVAASLWERLRQTHLAPIEHRVQPRLALPVDDLRKDLPGEPPALIKGYLRCGARVLGPPAWDPDFNTADFPLMLRFSDLPPKYRRHFLGVLTPALTPQA